MRIGGSGEGFGKVVGHRLELIPKSNPFLLKPGDKLAVEVRFDGKPLSDSGVEIGDGITAQKESEIPRYKTDAAGIAQVPIGKLRLQVVAVDYNTPSRTPEASSKDDYSATLTFVLRP